MGMFQRNSSPKKRTFAEYLLTHLLFVLSSETDLEKFSISSLAHQWILCSEWVAVRMRVQTADKNITIIHTTPIHQLMSCEVKAAFL